MHHRPSKPAPRAFTLVELLVALLIIGLLLSLTLVVATKATRSAQRSATLAFMRSISSGLEQFHQDLGFYPPLLADNAESNALSAVSTVRSRYVLAAQPDADERLREYRYYSLITLPLYLVGEGELDASASTGGGTPDPDRHDGVAGPGIRDPGPDHSWGGAVKRKDHRPPRTGRVFGPYLDVSSGRSMRPMSLDDAEGLPPRMDGSVLTTLNNLGYLPVNVFIDSWGSPIRYYQPLWPQRDPATKEYSLERAPVEVVSEEVIRAIGPNSDPEWSLDPSLDRELLSAPYILLSAGSDREFAAAAFARNPIDPDETNSEIIKTMATDAPAGETHGFPRFIRSIANNVRLTP